MVVSLPERLGHLLELSLRHNDECWLRKKLAFYLSPATEDVEEGGLLDCILGYVL